MRIRLLRLFAAGDRQDAVQPAAKLLQAQGYFDFGQAVVRFPQGGLHLVGAKLNQQVALLNARFLRTGMLMIVPRTSAPTVTRAPG